MVTVGIPPVTTTAGNLVECARVSFDRALHEKPTVPDFFSPFTPGRLQEGLVIAPEPIICDGRSEVVEDEGGWTIRTVAARRF